MYGPEEFAAEFDVSRETSFKLARYAELLREWQERMNLVGPSTLDHIWDRHFRDSAQLASLAPTLSHRPVWLDIGAGGGFPGLVLALLGAGTIHLVESIAKKCRFLAAVADELELGDAAVIHNKRVEKFERFRADVITARACADLAQLFDWGLPFAASSTIWLLPKGASVDEEITAARKRFLFDAELVPSRSDTRGRIVVAERVRRR
jgi:16S rRNA (guanine527-N7)-methyltransferase